MTKKNDMIDVTIENETVDIHRTKTNTNNHLNKMDEKRQAFWQMYSKQKKTNNIVLVPCMIASVLLFVILSNYYFIALILVALIMVALFIYTSKVKSRVESWFKDYITTYYTLLNEYTLEREEIVDLSYTPDETVKDKTFIDAGFILDVVSTNSRNVVHGKMLGNAFVVADLTSYVLVNNKNETCFLGKFFEVNNPIETNYKTVIYIKPTDYNGTGPNNIGGLEEIKTLGLPEQIVVWSNNPDVKKIFTKKLIAALEDFETNKDLVDVAISILNDKIYLALSYENDLMKIPLNEQVNTEVIEQYKNDVTKVVKIIKELTK